MGYEGKIGAIKCRDVFGSAQPVIDDFDRVRGLLGDTEVGAEFLEDKLMDMAPDRSIRCKDVDGLVADLRKELGVDGDTEVVDLIEQLQRQFDGARKGSEYFEKMKKKAKNWRAFSEKYDEMMNQESPIYPNKRFFNEWENHCATYVDYEGVLIRMTELGFEPSDKFVTGMIGVCDHGVGIIDIIKYVDGLDNGVTSPIKEALVTWAGNHKDQCDELIQFIKELVVNDDVTDLAVWGSFIEDIQTVIVLSDNDDRKKRGHRGRGPRGIVNSNARSARAKESGRKSPRTVEVVVLGSEDVRIIKPDL